MKESTVAAGTDRILNRRGAYVVNIHGAGIGRNGIADRLACYRGRFLALELKAPGRRPTRLQQYELDQAANAGAITAVITNPDQATQILDRIDAELDGQP
jgi:Holliday junction resolvase